MVVLYATVPEQSVVGWFEVDGVDIAAPSTLWRRYGLTTGLSHKEFNDYFSGCSRGVALRVGLIHRLAHPIRLSELGNVVPPQGFAYLSDDALAVLRACDMAKRSPTTVLA